MAMQTAAPGFVDLAHLAERRVVEVGWDIISDAVQTSARLHDEAMRKVMSTFVRTIDPTKPRIRFKLPVSTELQPLQGEDDSPVPVRGFDSYDIAFPLRDAGFAWGNNRKSRAKMTVQEANEITLVGLVADRNWLRRHIMAAMLYNQSYTFYDDEYGNLTIKPLANGDTDQYNLISGELSTDDHYLAQASSISDSNNPFPTIYDELTEHPTNTGDVVAYVSTSLKASIMGLTDFVPYYDDPRIRPGLSQDVVSSFPNVTIGDRKLGFVNDVYIVEWKALPSGYIIAHCPEAGPMIGMREEPEPELRGLRVETYQERNAHIVQRLLRTAGFAVMNRVGALVYYIGGSSYVVPSGYSQPLAV